MATSIKPNLEEAIPLTGIFKKKVKDIEDWGTISEIIDTAGKKKTVKEVLESNPDFEIYVDAKGQPFRHTAKNTQITSKKTKGTNPNNTRVPIRHSLSEIGSDGRSTYLDIYGNPTGYRTDVYGETPIEPSADLFYLTAPYLGIEDYITAKGMNLLGKSVNKILKNSSLGKAMSTKQLANTINTQINKSDIIPYHSLGAPKHINMAFDRAESFEKDARRRMINAISEEGRFMSNEEKNIINSTIEDSTPVTFENLGKINDKQIVGLANEAFIKLDKSLYDENNIDQLIKTIIHEREHNVRAKLRNLIKGEFKLNRLSKYNTLNQQNKDITNNIVTGHLYTPKEQELLNRAYSFTDDFLKDYKPAIIMEKGATNREIRATIREIFKDIVDDENGNIIPEKLDEVIDNLSRKQLMDIVNQVNGYSQNFATKYKSDLAKFKELIKNRMPVEDRYQISEDALNQFKTDNKELVKGLKDTEIVNRYVNELTSYQDKNIAEYLKKHPSVVQWRDDRIDAIKKSLKYVGALTPIIGTSYNYNNH